MVPWPVRVGLATLAGGLFASLLCVDIAAWRRGAALRRGRAPQLDTTGTDGRAGPSSPATVLAGLTGSSLLLLGGALVARPRVGAAIVAAGLPAALSGFRSRVVELRTDARGLTVRYRRRRLLRADWSSCSGLDPPRTPLGAWKLMTSGPGGTAPRPAVRRLMPSDVIGNEWFLAEVVIRSRMRFEDGAWRR